MTWQEVIDNHLIEIGRSLKSFDHRSMALPSLKTVSLAIILAQDYDREMAAEPTDVYVDHFGGIVFLRELDNGGSIACTICPNGSTEYYFRNAHGGGKREVVPFGRTDEKNRWNRDSKK